MAWLSRGIVAMGLLCGGLLVCPALSEPSRFISMPGTEAADEDSELHAQVVNACPQWQVEQIVSRAVAEALGKNMRIAAGLLRIYFHDCFPQGCDASILLTGEGSEQRRPENGGLQQAALDLIERIRVQAHQACGGPTVSCTDILALATRDAVVRVGGPRFEVTLNRLDSVDPASGNEVGALPKPDFNVEQLTAAFSNRGLNSTDLIALSGAHTIGKAQCSSFKDRFGEKNAFAQSLAVSCGNDGRRLQDLDVKTPERFDNKYYQAVREGKGVLTSDKVLGGHWMVNGFADNEGWFFFHFADSMKKLGNVPRARNARPGEIRRISCSVRNNGKIQTIVDHAAADARASA